MINLFYHEHVLVYINEGTDLRTDSDLYVIHH